jgi:hypothetical protein
METDFTNRKNEDLLINLYDQLRQVRREVEDAINKGEPYFGIVSKTREKIDPIFEQFGEDVQNGALPPLPELTAITHAFGNYWLYSEAANLLFYLNVYLHRQRDYLRFLFEALDYSEQCNCLILAHIRVDVSPQTQTNKLRETGHSDDLHDTYTDYVCEICGSKWRLEDTSTESVSSSHWGLQELGPKHVTLPDYDKYGKALAESRSQVALTVDTLKQVLNETLPSADLNNKNYHSLLQSLAMFGIVEQDGLRKVIASNFDEMVNS